MDESASLVRGDEGTSERFCLIWVRVPGATAVLTTLSRHTKEAVQPLWQPGVRGFALFFAVLYFVQGSVDLSAGLANQPVQYLLKEDMGLTASQAGFFWALIGLGWTIKPLYGLISDFFPLVGFHRKSYLILMSALGTGSWCALFFLPPRYSTVLLLLMACSLTLAFCDVMADALMVETGRPLGLTGSFQAVQWASMSVALTLAQLGGGYLSAHATAHTTFLIAALFPLATLISALLVVQEPRTSLSREHLQDTGYALQQAARSPTLWIVVGFLFLWNFSPSLGTPLLYYQVDTLQFSKLFIGTLGAISHMAGILGAGLFFTYCRAIPLVRLLYLAVALGVAATLGFLGLVGPKSAVMIFFLFGTISQITHLAVLDLAARSCPVRTEGTIFAFLMSALNVGRTSSAFLGGWLYDQLGFPPLIVVSAAFTALCWFIVPFVRGQERL